MFKDVDLTGINSIEVTASVNLRGTTSNGETLVIMADDYKRGEPLGYITLSDDGDNIKERTSIRKIDGVHDLYFYCLYGKQTGTASMKIHDITLSAKGLAQIIIIGIIPLVAVAVQKRVGIGLRHVGHLHFLCFAFFPTP